jgi:acetyltransferase
MLDYLANEPDTRAILLYVEAVTAARKFISAARAASRTTPVIVVKAGRHAEGARAAASHTGALAGSDAVYDAVFRRAGMLRVRSLDEVFAAVETLDMARPPRGDRLAIVTNERISPHAERELPCLPAKSPFPGTSLHPNCP